jgi:hypothetical protein
MKVLAANRLIDGEAVWLAPDGRWAETLQAAEIARDPDRQSRLAEAGKASAARNEVLDVELIDVEFVDGRIVPIRLRERIRAGGPSIHPELGKQARFAVASAA